MRLSMTRPTRARSGSKARSLDDCRVAVLLHQQSCGKPVGQRLEGLGIVADQGIVHVEADQGYLLEVEGTVYVDAHRETLCDRSWGVKPGLSPLSGSQAAYEHPCGWATRGAPVEFCQA